MRYIIGLYSYFKFLKNDPFLPRIFSEFLVQKILFLDFFRVEVEP